MKHIIYIPGLGDRYDGVRRLALKLWRRDDVRVTHVSMNWLDPDETMEQKIKRVYTVVEAHPAEDVTVVGESAGGGMAIVVANRFADQIKHVVTVCGMNQGAANVNPDLYDKNPAFQEVMRAADTYVPLLGKQSKSKMYILYSSLDYTVRPRHSLIDGVRSRDLKIPGHIFAILWVLFWKYRTILSEIAEQ